MPFTGYVDRERDSSSDSNRFSILLSRYDVDDIFGDDIWDGGTGCQFINGFLVLF